MCGAHLRRPVFQTDGSLPCCRAAAGAAQFFGAGDVARESGDDKVLVESLTGGRAECYVPPLFRGLGLDWVRRMKHYATLVEKRIWRRDWAGFSALAPAYGVWGGGGALGRKIEML
jgi:hypothetical protein